MIDNENKEKTFSLTGFRIGDDITDIMGDKILKLNHCNIPAPNGVEYKAVRNSAGKMVLYDINSPLNNQGNRKKPLGGLPTLFALATIFFATSYVGIKGIKEARIADEFMAAPSVIYNIKKGDTLLDVAKKYGMSDPDYFEVFKNVYAKDFKAGHSIDIKDMTKVLAKEYDGDNGRSIFPDSAKKYWGFQIFGKK